MTDDSKLLALRDALALLIPETPFVLIVGGEVIGHVASLDDAKAMLRSALRGLEQGAELHEVT